MPRVDWTADFKSTSLSGRLAGAIEAILQPIAADLHALGRCREDAS